MKGKNVASLSLILSLVSVIPLIIAPNTINGMKIFAIIGLIVGVIAVILGFIGKKTVKGKSITGIVIGLISSVLLLLTFTGLNVIENYTDCIKTENGLATCYFKGQKAANVPIEFLREDQFKK